MNETTQARLEVLQLIERKGYVLVPRHMGTGQRGALAAYTDDPALAYDELLESVPHGAIRQEILNHGHETERRHPEDLANP